MQMTMGRISRNPGGQLGVDMTKFEKFLKIFDPAIALTSQIITGKAKNPTQQIAVSQNGTVLGLQNPNLQYTQQQQQSSGLTDADRAALIAAASKNQSGSGALGDGLNGLINWGTENLGIVTVGAVMVWLFTRTPPRISRGR